MTSAGAFCHGQKLHPSKNGAGLDVHNSPIMDSDHGSVRRECLDHIPFVGDRQLHRGIRE